MNKKAQAHYIVSVNQVPAYQLFILHFIVVQVVIFCCYLSHSETVFLIVIILSSKAEK